MKPLLIVILAVLFTHLAQSQSITLSLKNAGIEKAFKAIERQSDYSFIYGRSQLKNAKPVTIQVKKESIDVVLQIIFKDQPLTYTLSGKYVSVKEKDKEVIRDELSSDISGRVLDEKNQPVEGASITVSGSNQGTTSNADGYFELKNVSSAGQLTVSGANIESRQVDVAGKTNVVINTASKVKEEEEVVVNAGYYNVKQREATGSISKVGYKTIEKQPVLNPLAAIQGRMTGVSVQQTTGIPGGDFKIEIRGRNSLRQESGNPVGNDPLYIIDGVPFSMEKVSSPYTTAGLYTGGGASPLNGINNADIESIEILKDADATAIYGSRGANGVVLITTKKGKAGKTRLEVNMYTGVGKAPMLKMLNRRQYLDMRYQAFANDELIPTSDISDQGNNGKAYALDLMVWDTSRYTDWQSELVGKAAKSSSVQLSLSGGSEGTQFILSAGYRKEGSILPADFNYTKGSSHLSINHHSTNRKLKLNVNVTGTVDKNNQLPYDLLSVSRVLPPVAPALYKADGTLNWENSSWTNPLAEMIRKYHASVNTFVYNGVIAYQVLKPLAISTSFGFTQVQSSERTTNPSTAYDPARGYSSKYSSVTASRGLNESWIAEPQVAFEKKIGDVLITSLVGTTFQQQRFERFADFYGEFPSNALLENLPTATIKNSREFVTSLYRYIALFARINFNIRDKYFVNVTGRRDGSSRFGNGKQFANFGAAGAGWLFSSEKWAKKALPFLNFGKLRASYGITGNDQIGNYQYLATYTSINGEGIIPVYDGITGLNPSRLFNPEYGWEANRKVEVAVELSFLRNRINISTAYYKNTSSNQLISYALPGTTGFNSILSNFPAIVRNTGLELEFNSTNVKTRNVNWTTTFNISFPENKLVSFPSLESSTYSRTYILGQSIYMKKFFEFTGVDPATGYYTVKDFNKNGVISYEDDREKVVVLSQEFYGGIGSSLRLKNWNLEVFFQFVKQRMYNYFGAGSPSFGNPYGHPAFLLSKRIWQNPGDVAAVQRISTEYNSDAIKAQADYNYSDAGISNALYTRCKNIYLSYKIPQGLPKTSIWHVFIQAQNLFVISSYEGIDPESQQISTPPLRMLAIGCKAEF